MTVSTIGPVALEAKRTLDTQTKNSAKTETALLSGGASLPTDTVESVVSNPTLTVAQAAAQTEQENRTAALSTLSDADIDLLASEQSPQAIVQAQANASVAAQANRLPPSMLQLLVE